MGYSHPIQLTQWALASAPGHPLLSRYMDILSQRLQEVEDRNGGDLRCENAAEELREIGTLDLTGPGAITVSTRSWLEEKTGLRWNALSGLQDDGRSKVVDDVMILPITGFRYSFSFSLLMKVSKI
jgi:hypothetical protein